MKQEGRKKERSNDSRASTCEQKYVGEAKTVVETTGRWHRKQRNRNESVLSAGIHEKRIICQIRKKETKKISLSLSFLVDAEEKKDEASWWRRAHE